MSNKHARSETASAFDVALAIVWAGVIFWMSAHTGGQMGTGVLSAIAHAINGFFAGFGIQGDSASVLGHFSEYLVFGVLLANALRGRVPRKWLVLAAVGIASLYGVSDEIHQFFVPGRMCDPFDWAVDTLAATLGAAGYCLLVLRDVKGHGRAKGT